ncbi:MAG: GNAT family N-acetyltransferase [Gammaproteobacteria bacterium]|nr:GNAT family N-acetyltransferase [Gammaproteobacteria bacterium]
MTKLLLATESDIDVLLPFVREYHKFEKLVLSNKEREASVRTLLNTKELGKIWLIWSSEEVVGYIVLCVGYSIEFGGLDAFIDEFYISTKFRGIGIGTKVLELIKVEAKNMKVRTIHLEVAKTNCTAKNIYSRSQFKAREKYVLMSVNL